MCLDLSRTGIAAEGALRLASRALHMARHFGFPNRRRSRKVTGNGRAFRHLGGCFTVRPIRFFWVTANGTSRRLQWLGGPGD